MVAREVEAISTDVESWGFIEHPAGEEVGGVGGVGGVMDVSDEIGSFVGGPEGAERCLELTAG